MGVINVDRAVLLGPNHFHPAGDVDLPKGLLDGFLFDPTNGGTNSGGRGVTHVVIASHAGLVLPV